MQELPNSSSWVMLVTIRIIQSQESVENGIFTEGVVRVCGDAVLGCFWYGFAVIFILTCGIAISKH